MDLENILKNEEGKQLEYKRDLSSPKNIMQTIVAFGNTAGGVILIGIEDGSKEVVGVENPTQEEEKLANIIADSIAPQIVPGIEVLSWRGRYLIKIDVYLSGSRPHYLKASGVEGGTYMRVGSSNRRVDMSGVEEIKREVLRMPFDEMPLGDYGVASLDFEMIQNLFKGIRVIEKKDLETLKLLTKHQSRLVPTVAGMLLFGKEREKIFSDSWIQCGLFKGKNKVNIIDTVEIHDYPVIAIEKAMDFIKKHSNFGYEIEGLRRKESWSRPLTALREALINAVVHCDYSQTGSPIRLSIFEDRVEIENPGLLVSGLTIDEIQQGVSKLRNKNIARVFKELKLIEQWGSGIQRMKENCRDSGFDDPIFEEIGTHFRVSIFTQKKEQLINLSKQEVKILRLLKGAEGLKTKDLAETMKLSPKSIVTYINALVEKGFVGVIGMSLRDPKRKYVLSATGEKLVF